MLLYATEGRYLCPDCNTPLRLIFSDPNQPKEYCCPIALEAQRRGLLGQEGRKHKIVFVFSETTEYLTKQA